MKTFLLYILVLLTVLFALLTSVWATEPDAVAAAARSRKMGKVLVLLNEQTLEGEITHIGSQYRVRRTVGETWVPARQVMYLCQTMEEAFACVQHRANLDDPDERLRLADWCRLHGLRNQAIAEIRAAAQLRPDHRGTRRLLNHLEKSPHPASTAALPVKHEELATPPLTLSEEALGSFAARVQPILMNTCASCHSNGKGGSYRLVRAYELGIGDRRITQHNLTATMAQINPGHPERSLLLIRAVSVHGPMSQAPLRSRQVRAYRVLEEWIHKVVADNPQLLEPAGTPPPPVEKPAVIVPAVQHSAAPVPSLWGAEAPRPAPAPAQGASQTPAPPAGTAPPASPTAGPPPQGVPPRLFPNQMPPTRPADEDPYDPEQFNRQTHPEGQPPPPKP